MDKPQKTKVIAYIFRESPTQISQINELLVFEHEPQYVDAGIQVVGGTVEVNEDFKEALVREVFEESGLIISKDKWIYIGDSLYSRKDCHEMNHRHYFATKVENAPDRWDHRVHSDGSDNGMIFSFYWISFEEAKKVLTGNFAELLPLIPS